MGYFIMVRASKFNVAKDKTDRIYNGIVFDSAIEMKYYRDVVIPGLESGEIVNCERQKVYILQEKFQHAGKTISAITYKADFVVQYKDGSLCVVDIKGCPDNVAKLKRKLFWFKYPDISYEWIGYSKLDGGWTTYEKIQAGRKERKKIKERNKKENKE